MVGDSGAFLVRVNIEARCVPAKELPHAGHVNGPVVECGVGAGQVELEPFTVEGDRVAGKQEGAGGGETGEVGFAFFVDGVEGEAGAVMDFFKQTVVAVHGCSDQVEVVLPPGGGFDDLLVGGANDIELGVGDDDGDFEQRPGVRVESGGFGVDPGE